MRGHRHVPAHEQQRLRQRPPPPNGTIDAGSGATCTETGTCGDGTPYFTCTETTDAGQCLAAVVIQNGAEFGCESCLNCAAATASAVSACPSVNVPDAGPDCGSPPTLDTELDAGVYCPFTAAGAVHCGAGQECCEAPADAGGTQSTCEAKGATCSITGAIAWQCDGPLDCAGSAAGAVCCGHGAVNEDTTCGFHRGAGFTDTHCAASCLPGEVTICDSTSGNECPVGTTCTAFKMAGVVLGTCL